MTQPEYEKLNQQCWEKFRSVDNPRVQRQWFNYAFDRAYALGKQETDAVGEEMLTVICKRAQEIYHYNEDILSQDPTHKGAILLKSKFQELFGSKCLPDNVDTLADNVDSLESKPADLNTDRPTCTDVCSSQIDERLRIAAQMMQGMLSNPAFTDMQTKPDILVELAIITADKLISNCDKQGNSND